MTKKDFIGLADTIRTYNAGAFPAGANGIFPLQFQYTQLYVLADFCKQANPRFNREQWFDYIAGKCGPNGGTRKKKS